VIRVRVPDWTAGLGARASGTVLEARLAIDPTTWSQSVQSPTESLQLSEIDVAFQYVEGLPNPGQQMTMAALAFEKLSIH